MPANGVTTQPPSLPKTMQLIIGFLLAIIIATLAYSAHSLTKSGAVAAALVGAVVFGLGGWQWAVLLLIFFITSSALSRLFKNHKKGLDEKFSKGHERDAGQVFGNGGLATVFVFIHALYPESNYRVDRIRRRFGGGQCGYVGDRIGGPESNSTAHDHGFEKARRKRDLGWSLPLWNVRVAVGRFCHRIARSLVHKQLVAISY